MVVIKVVIPVNLKKNNVTYSISCLLTLKYQAQVQCKLYLSSKQNRVKSCCKIIFHIERSIHFYAVVPAAVWAVLVSWGGIVVVYVADCEDPVCGVLRITAVNPLIWSSTVWFAEHIGQLLYYFISWIEWRHGVERTEAEKRGFSDRRGRRFCGREQVECWVTLKYVAKASKLPFLCSSLFVLCCYSISYINLL